MTQLGASDRWRIDLTGQTALVTGGSRNIGLAIAEALLSAGASVAVTAGRDEAVLRESVKSLSAHGQVRGYLFRAEDAAQTESLATAVEDDLGSIDLLVNSAAIRPHQPLSEITAADWDRVLNVNLRAPFLLSQRLGAGMAHRGHGRIINISGLDAYWGKAGRPHVVAGKAGIIGLTRALATEFAATGVTVNAVVPGTIDTNRHTPDWYPDLEAFYAARTSRIPMGRLGRPEEVAAVVLFLASHLSSYMTGQTLFATGGAFPLVKEQDEVHQ